MTRKIKGLIWILLGFLAFYLIGFEAKSHFDERSKWPTVEARVLSAELSNYVEAQGVSDRAGLLVNVIYQNAEGVMKTASFTHSGDLKTIKELKVHQYRDGATLNVRISPDGSTFHPPNTSTTGMWVLAIVMALFFILNGMTILNRKEKA
tara:strand:+ start:459 stop:908 length:450 start_codon:yes stop_codon:yes gene_type:complete